MIYRTFEEILTSIKQQIEKESNLDTREGSFVDTVTRAAAMEIFNAYFDQQALLPIAFVDETSGSYIDRRAAEYGLIRKSGTRARATVIFSGSDGKVVAAGTPVQTQDGLVFTTDEPATVVSSTAVVPVTAEHSGTQYNIAEDAITALQNSAGVSIAHASAAVGGTDDESDDALLSRLYALWQKPSTSGNAHQYEAWALEIDGIGAAKIWPTWNGPGTVKVVILDSEMQPPTAEQVRAVAAHIELQRPICVDVTVTAAVQMTIDVSATVQMDASISLRDVKDRFAQLLGAYCKALAFQSQTVVYNRIAHMLLSIDGVTDFTSLKVNGAGSNIALADNAVPVLGSVTLQ